MVDKDINAQLNELKGWVMLASSQPLSTWNIAWVTASSLPTPKLCVVLESEANAKPTTSQFEEIASITEIEESSKQDKEVPVKFEITTKNNNCFKIITNSFMTTGMRNLARTLATIPYPKQMSSGRKISYKGSD
jgi:hypothetical protein